MKTISFFSEKGGVGKSSFTMLYASWLKYRHGVKVGVADFNNRISNYRDNELQNIRRAREKNPDAKFPDTSPLSTWPIARATAKEIEDIRREGSMCPNSEWLNQQLTRGDLCDEQVIICDFPGSLSGNEFIEVVGMGLLGLVVLPTEKEQMTLTSTLRLWHILSEPRFRERLSSCIFINRAQVNLPNVRKKYVQFAQSLIQRNLPVLPDMIAQSDKMSTMDKVDIIRSTLQYPDFTASAYKPGNDLGLENLFIDITRELSKTKDLRNTAPADLSFVDSLVKKWDNRQFSPSGFPEYDLNQEM